MEICHILLTYFCCKDRMEERGTFAYLHTNIFMVTNESYEEVSSANCFLDTLIAPYCPWKRKTAPTALFTIQWVSSTLNWDKLFKVGFYPHLHLTPRADQCFNHEHLIMKKDQDGLRHSWPHITQGGVGRGQKSGSQEPKSTLLPALQFLWPQLNSFETVF